MLKSSGNSQHILIIMKNTSSIVLLALVIAPFQLQSMRGAVTAVDWGGPYAGADLPFADDVAANRSGSDKYGDPHGTFPDGPDSVTGRALSLDSPFSPTSGYSGVSDTFYGGGSVTREGTGTNDGFSEISILNQGPNDSIHWHVDTGGDSHTFHVLIYWDKSDFLGGLDAISNLTLGGGGATITTAQASGHHTDELLRWVVRDGTQFYVSDETVTLTNNDTFSVTYENVGNWAGYSPNDPAGAPTLADLQSLDFDESGPYNPHTFTDVTGLGFYVEHEAATGPIHVHIEEFSATIPEPSHALLTLLGLSLLSARRRR